MAEIRFVLYLRDYSGERLNQIKNIFANTAFFYNIYGYEVGFSTEVSSKTVKNPHSRGSITDIQVSFIGDLPAEIDVERNDVYYYDGPKNIQYKKSDVAKLRKYFKHDCLDEDFQTQLEIFCLSMVQAIILTDPSLDINTGHFKIYIDQMPFKEKKHIEYYPMHEISYDEWRLIFRTSLEITKVWDWLLRNGIKFSSKPKCPTVSLLYYLLNRDYHEILLYSVIGLEALYGDRNRRNPKSPILQNRINAVFPSVAKRQVKKLYDVRSSISHGVGDISSAIAWLDIINNNKEYEELAILSSALLIESIRMLVANDATSFVFKEEVNVSYGFE